MIEDLLEQYFETFGLNYPIMVTECKSNEEIIADIKKSLEENTPAEDPKYESGFVY